MKTVKFYQIVNGEIKTKWRAFSNENEIKETTKEIINGWNVYNENEINAIFKNEEVVM